MANPTNVNVPPAKAADPTNINVPVHGTKFPSGVTGADQIVTLNQGGTDRPTGDTNKVLDSWLAPYDGYIRYGNYQSVTITATATFNIYNNTTSTSVVNAVTPTAGTAAALTFASAGAQSFSQGDEIQLRGTTSGSGVLGGVQVHLFVTPLAGSTTNPV